MNKIVTCEKYRMLNMSLSTLFGKTPKIEYTCGSCGAYNTTRLPMESVRLGRPYTICRFCGTTNNIPIRIVNDYDEEEY